MAPVLTATLAGGHTSQEGVPLETVHVQSCVDDCSIMLWRHSRSLCCLQRRNIQV